MKVWSVIFNFIGVAILLVMLQCIYIQWDAWDKDFETARLGYQSDYATEAGFIKAMDGGRLNITYADLTNAELSPQSVLYGFQSVMCIGYDKIINEDNINEVNSLIETSVLACSNGYYMTPVKKNVFDKMEVTYDWSCKIPYALNQSDMSETLKLSLANKSNMRKDEISAGLFTLQGNKIDILGSGDIEFERLGSVNISKKDRRLIISNINKQINGAIIDNIVNVQSADKSITHKIYLPSSRTSKGLNDISSPSLIVALSGKGFTTKGFINETVMSGYKLIRKMYVVGYKYQNKNADGSLKAGSNYRYCYETQLPEGYEKGTDTRGPIKIEKFYSSMERAAYDGYSPDLEYLQHRIRYDVS